MSKLNLLVASVASSSTGKPRPVKTDGERLTCACPGWTMRIQPNGERECKHTREVAQQLTDAGLTLKQAVAMLQSGALQPTGVGQALNVPVKDAIQTEAERLAYLFRGQGAVTFNVVALATEIEKAIRKFVGVAPAMSPAMSGRPQWLGGARAIILRD